MTTLACTGWGPGSGTGRERRESYAKNAKESQKIQKNTLCVPKPIAIEFSKLQPGCNFFISYFSPLSRPSRIFRAFRGRKFAFAAMATSHPSGGAAQ
jgi:hypothetical protein